MDGPARSLILVVAARTNQLFYRIAAENDNRRTQVVGAVDGVDAAARALHDRLPRKSGVVAVFPTAAQAAKKAEAHRRQGRVSAR